MSKELYLIRHAIAEDRTEFKNTGLSDDQRPLVKKGIKKMKLIADWFGSYPKMPVDYIFESPLLRSQQTVDILLKNLQAHQRVMLPELGPSFPPEAVCKKLDNLKWTSAVLVGHEPHLSHLICYLTGVSAKHYAEFEMKKGGIAFFKVTQKLSKRRAQMQWLLTPQVLTSLIKF